MDGPAVSFVLLRRLGGLLCRWIRAAASFSPRTGELKKNGAL